MKIVTKSSNQNLSASYLRMAQSASALGAAILGFGLGAKWGSGMERFAFLTITAGGIFHLYGIYIMQMKNHTMRTHGIAMILWLSAWICLIALIAIVIYLIILES